jgi:hypothetical protein
MCHGKEEEEMEGIRPAGIGSRRGALAQDAFGRGRRGGFELGCWDWDCLALDGQHEKENMGLGLGRHRKARKGLELVVGAA